MTIEWKKLTAFKIPTPREKKQRLEPLHRYVILDMPRHKREIPELRKEFQLRGKMGFNVEFFVTAVIHKRFSFSRRTLLHGWRPNRSSPLN